jgi:hypothetical protein
MTIFKRILRAIAQRSSDSSPTPRKEPTTSPPPTPKPIFQESEFYEYNSLLLSLERFQKGLSEIRRRNRESHSQDLLQMVLFFHSVHPFYQAADQLQQLANNLTDPANRHLETYRALLSLVQHLGIVAESDINRAATDELITTENVFLRSRKHGEMSIKDIVDQRDKVEQYRAMNISARIFFSQHLDDMIQQLINVIKGMEKEGYAPRYTA